jgi:putative flippase GtrA
MGSAITTGVSFAVLTMVFGVLRLWSEVPSTLAANLSATIPSYFLNRNWAWGKSGRSRVWREMVPFWVTSVTGIVVSLGAAQLARTFSDDHHLHHLLATVVVDGANLTTFAVLWVGKFLIFDRLFRSSASPLLGDELVEAA